jgi:hypothetical protein
VSSHMDGVFLNFLSCCHFTISFLCEICPASSNYCCFCLTRKTSIFCPQLIVFVYLDQGVSESRFRDVSSFFARYARSIRLIEFRESFRLANCSSRLSTVQNSGGRPRPRSATVHLRFTYTPHRPPPHALCHNGRIEIRVLASFPKKSISIRLQLLYLPSATYSMTWSFSESNVLFGFLALLV